jgi:hypothetical protein
MSEGKKPRKSDPALLGQALSHPLRVAILMRMNSPLRDMSPSEYAKETGEILANCSYHFRQLRDYGLIEETRTQPVRGATEHFYRPVKKAMAWKKTYGAMPDAVKQNLASTALGGAVLSIGNSVDAGTFDSHPDPHLSYDQMLIDEQGWRKLIGIFNGALLAAIKVRDEALERLEGGASPEAFVASYLLSAWEAAPLDHPSLEEERATPTMLPRLDQLGCFPHRELVRLLDVALEGMRAQPPDSYAPDYREMRREVERLLREAGEG